MKAWWLKFIEIKCRQFRVKPVFLKQLSPIWQWIHLFFCCIKNILFHSSRRSFSYGFHSVHCFPYSSIKFFFKHSPWDLNLEINLYELECGAYDRAITESTCVIKFADILLKFQLKILKLTFWSIVVSTLTPIHRSCIS